MSKPFLSVTALFTCIIVLGQDGNVFSRTIIDGMSRPVDGAAIRLSYRAGETSEEKVVRSTTGVNGEFSIALPRTAKVVHWQAEKKGYVTIAGNLNGNETRTAVMRRSISVQDISALIELKGRELEQALAEILAGRTRVGSKEDAALFAIEDHLQASLKKLLKHKLVSGAAKARLRRWYDSWDSAPPRFKEVKPDASLESVLKASIQQIPDRGAKIRCDVIFRAENRKSNRVMVIYGPKSAFRHGPKWHLRFDLVDGKWHLKRAMPDGANYWSMPKTRP